MDSLYDLCIAVVVQQRPDKKSKWRKYANTITELLPSTISDMLLPVLMSSNANITKWNTIYECKPLKYITYKAMYRYISTGKSLPLASWFEVEDIKYSECSEFTLEFPTLDDKSCKLIVRSCYDDSAGFSDVIVCTNDEYFSIDMYTKCIKYNGLSCRKTHSSNDAKFIKYAIKSGVLIPKLVPIHSLANIKSKVINCRLWNLKNLQN